MDRPEYQDGDKLIWRTDDDCFIIAEGGWMPGVYADLETAKLAFSIDEEILSALQKSVNPGGTITMKMLLKETL